MFKPKTNTALMIVWLLVHNKGEPMTVIQLGAKIGRCTSNIEQVLANLRDGYLVKARRKPGGGYILTTTPDRYTVGMVLEAMMEPEPNTELFQELIAALDNQYINQLSTPFEVLK